MTWILEPLASGFFTRAVVGSALAAAICAIAGTWVVLRGLAFLGEALSHGMLPGVAIASVLGAPAMLGAAVSAAVMSLGISRLARRGAVSHDTSIGLLFVGMLSIGVIVVSHADSFATDVTSILFGDVLAIRQPELATLALGLVVTLVTAIAFHRPFIALAVDARTAHTLGLRPRLAQAVLVGLVTLAVVACYQAVGTLLVVGLLIGPAAASLVWSRGVAIAMLLAAGIGIASTTVGLLISWHAGTAAGATIAATAVASYGISAGMRAAWRRIHTGQTTAPHDHDRQLETT